MTNPPQFPEPIDASAPGVFNFDTLAIYGLGNARYIVVLSKAFFDEAKGNPDWSVLSKGLEKALGSNFLMVVGDKHSFVPLEQSADLRSLIREIVQEEVKVDHAALAEELRRRYFEGGSAS